MTIEEFIKKYGVETFGLLIGKFIKLAPEFEGGGKLAQEIGKISGDLESALIDYNRRNPSTKAKL